MIKQCFSLANSMNVIPYHWEKKKKKKLDNSIECKKKCEFRRVHSLITAYALFNISQIYFVFHYLDKNTVNEIRIHS